jgi:hypothetical protein
MVAHPARCEFGASATDEEVPAAVRFSGTAKPLAKRLRLRLELEPRPEGVIFRERNHPLTRTDEGGVRKSSVDAHQGGE